MPWEQAIHVRKGRKVKLKEKGIYFKIPFIDTIFIQTTRMKVIDVPAQTVTTKEGKSITIITAIQYTIGDIQVLYNTMSHPEMTLSSLVMSEVADYVFKSTDELTNAKDCQKQVNKRIKGNKFGLKDVKISITSWADVPTFRLIMDGSGVLEGLDMTSTTGEGVD
jgi:regulator of protease activity HflC (stomatin/prohibitin superfamily)